jgi:hypothetical protein
MEPVILSSEQTMEFLYTIKANFTRIACVVASVHATGIVRKASLESPKSLGKLKLCKTFQARCLSMSVRRDRIN